MITQPEYIAKLYSIPAPIQYKWNSDIALKFFGAKDQNVKLYKAIDRASFHAIFSLGIAISESIVWRFKGHTDLTDALNRIEAGWAASIDPAYSRELRMDLTRDDDLEIIEAPLDMALKILGILDTRYRKQSNYLPEPVVKQAVLAQYLLPDKKIFSAWLSGQVQRLVDVFPRAGGDDEHGDTYDASYEKPVPREFFEDSFEYSDAACRDALRRFLAGLDPATNPFLNRSEEMSAVGFAGTPYSL